MRRQAITAIICITAIGLAACGSSGSGTEHARFSAMVDNPWLPLRPGTTLVYEGAKGRERQRDVFTVTHRTRTVGGAPCVVVDDRVYSNGRLSERTNDYYTQDRAGNVWYFGEDTAELDSSGRVTSTEGTWHAGVDGAKAGLFMPAHPHVGEQHRQEYYAHHAEDHFRVVSLASPIKTPYGNFSKALETHEWTPLEPGVLDAKYYVRGVGQVFEGSLKGPHEVGRLVAVRHG
jgi:hypothetical protein